MLTRNHTVLPATHTVIHNWNTILAFTPQPQIVTALLTVLIFLPAESRRLSWPEWLVTNEGGLPARAADSHPSQY